MFANRALMGSGERMANGELANVFCFPSKSAQISGDWRFKNFRVSWRRSLFVAPCLNFRPISVGARRRDHYRENLMGEGKEARDPRAPAIFVVNCGSSSLKFACFVGSALLAEGVFERLGSAEARGRWVCDGQKGSGEFHDASHESAVRAAVEILERSMGKPLRIDGVGHRVVHGGEFFRSACVIDEGVLEKIHSCGNLAPLHNPANLLGIGVARKLFPGVPHVAVFDTAFHQTLPERASLYAIPYELYERHGVRRYGFHGTSHAYVARRAAEAMGKRLEQLHLITAHLGNGCSACAVREGRSIDTTMGLTPLEGLVMGTRSGDVDPGLAPFLERVAGMSPEEVADLLNRRSGLLGISGLSNDMRTVTAAAAGGHARAALAVEIFCYRLAKAILALGAGLDRVDALVFTGGIGENSPLVREKAILGLGILGAEIDPELNDNHGRATAGRITSGTSRLLGLVIPTNEELAIAQTTATFL
jgi:acetate kinase